MSTEGNPTENTVESSENKLALRHSNSRNNSRVIADGGATWNDLTGFQRDMLEAIAELECDGEVPYGLAVKEELNRDYHEDVNHGRLYPNLDQLVEYGFIEKNELDRRTNEYPLTETGRRMLETRTRRMAQSLGLNVESANQAAVTDGGRDER